MNVATGTRRPLFVNFSPLGRPYGLKIYRGVRFRALRLVFSQSVWFPKNKNQTEVVQMHLENRRSEIYENIRMARPWHGNGDANEPSGFQKSGHSEVLMMVLQQTSESHIALCLTDLQDSALDKRPQAIKNVVERIKDLAFIHATMSSLKEGLIGIGRL